MLKAATMKLTNHAFRSRPFGVVTGLVLTAAVGFAQTPGWRRLGDPDPAQTAQAQPAPPQYGNDPATPVARPDDTLPPPPTTEPPAGTLPPRLVIPGGKFLTVRVNQPLSTDHNQAGDFFSATLAEPLVVDGIVVAQAGQTLNGRVSQVDKGGRVSGVAKLGLELTQLTAVDGSQYPIQTQLIGRKARSTEGRDAAAIAGTTGLGAAIGAAADWGRGAAIGAGAGAAVGIVGVLLSRGAPAVVYPETLLSFQIQGPVNVNTERAPQAFRYVDPNEYRLQPALQAGPPRPVPGPAPYPYAGYYGPAYPYPYAYGPYPYWGPSFGVVIGPRFYGGRGYYYRGWRR
jgi:hypothetical protein